MSSQSSFESGSYDDTEIVTIYDDEGRSLDCYIENEIEYTNIIYVSTDASGSSYHNFERTNSRTPEY